MRRVCSLGAAAGSIGPNGAARILVRSAITGRLASMGRAEATQLIHAHGGTITAVVTPETSFLIVGQAPLRKDGAVTGRLRKAHRLQERGCPIEIVTEEAFLRRLSPDHPADIHRAYTAAQVCRILRVAG